jgi:hypothetical protein
MSVPKKEEFCKAFYLLVSDKVEKSRKSATKSNKALAQFSTQGKKSGKGANQ